MIPKTVSWGSLLCFNDFPPYHLSLQLLHVIFFFKHAPFWVHGSVSSPFFSGQPSLHLSKTRNSNLAAVTNSLTGEPLSVLPICTTGINNPFQLYRAFFTYCSNTWHILPNQKSASQICTGLFVLNKSFLALFGQDSVMLTHAQNVMPIWMWMEKIDLPSILIKLFDFSSGADTRLLKRSLCSLYQSLTGSAQEFKFATFLPLSDFKLPALSGPKSPQVPIFAIYGGPFVLDNWQTGSPLRKLLQKRKWRVTALNLMDVLWFCKREKHILLSTLSPE